MLTTKIKRLVIVLLLSLSHGVFSQEAPTIVQNTYSTPNLINYQGVLRDASGNLIANTPIVLEINLTTNTIGTGTVYSEQLTATTNAYGMFNIQYGDGGDVFTSGNFSTINWANGPYYLHISYKLASSSGSFTELGYSNQLVAVPYALHAKTAESIVGGSITETDPVFIASPANNITSNDINNWNSPSWTKTATTVYTDKMVGIGTTTPTKSLEIIDAGLSDTKQTVLNIVATNTVGGTGFNEALSVDLNSTTSSNAGANGVYSLSHGVNNGSNRGVVGEAYGATGSNYGVFGLSRGTQGTSIGVNSRSTGINSGSNIGMYTLARNSQLENIGLSSYAINNATAQAESIGVFTAASGVSSNDNIGVFARANGSTMQNRAFHGEAFSTGAQRNTGLYLSAGDGSDSNYGVDAYTTGGGLFNYGVAGNEAGSTGTNIGIYGSSIGGANHYAGYFSGNVTITGNLNVQGNLSKAGGTFKIDHPEDPANKYLVHSFVESPEMMNIYNGNTKTDANGYSIIELPSYFEKINKDFRYQLTVIGTFAQAIVKEKVANNKFVIQTNEPNVEVSWQVTGIRADKWANENRVVPELEKTEKGTYIHPELYGQTKESKESYVPVVVQKRKTIELKSVIIDEK
jgi:hypothetical protein